MFKLEKALIPLPKKIEDRGTEIKIASFGKALCTVKNECDDVRACEGVSLIEKKLADIAAADVSATEGAYPITLKVDPADPKLQSLNKAEAYYIEIDETQATLCGADAAGVFYAAVTFADIIHSCGEDVCIPAALIVDYPDFPCRGHFMECRYGSEFMTKQNWFDAIDYMAKMKINQITVGVYGCWSFQYDSRHVEYLYVPIKNYPQLKTPKNIKYYSVEQEKWVHEDNILPYMFEQDYLGEVIAYGKRKNVTVKPLFNSLGHNTLIPRMIPEIAAKDEHGNAKGRGFCTKNEKTYEVMFNIYDEIIERYLKPNGITSIEIGLDEVGEGYICHCEQCEGKAHSELMVEYIIKICKHLKAKGMERIYIYHDMLYHQFNIVNEDLRDLFIREGIYDVVVLDWWTYEDPKHLFWDKPEGVNNLFHSVIKPDTGYYNWAIPTENNENIRACAKMAKDLGFEGMETYSSFEYCYDKNYLTLADVSWNADQIDCVEEFNERYAYRNYPENMAKALNAFNGLSDIMKDETGECYMNRVCYKFEHYFYTYRRGESLQIQNFPGAAYQLLASDEKTFVPYFEFLKQKSKTAVDFFQNSGSSAGINSIWLLTSRHYYTVADEYLTLYGLNKSYNENIADEYEVLRELDRLIVQRESLMSLAEQTRIATTSYTYLRNMSIFRQFMLDLRAYFKREMSAGRKPRLDMTDLTYATGETFDFLR